MFAKNWKFVVALGVLALSLAAVAAPAATLKLRLDASQLTYADGAPLSAWSNTESGGGTFSQGTPAYQPLFRSNALGTGKKGVVFDGGDDTMNAGNLSGLLTGSTSATLYAVVTVNNDAHFNVLTDEDAGRDAWWLNSSTHCYVSNFRTARANDIAVGTQSSGSHLWSIDGTSAQNTIYVDAANKGNWTAGSFAIGTTWTLSGIGGTVFNADKRLNGAIHEILVFDAGVSADQRAGLDYVMNQKWGLGLSVTATGAQIAAANALLGIAEPASDIPEPATLILLGAGLAGLLRHARRRLRP